MFFQTAADFFKISEVFWQLFGHGSDGFGGAHAGHHIFTLSVGQVLAIKDFFASGRVAGKGHTGAAIVTGITKYHGLNVHSSTPLRRDAVLLAVQDGPVVFPGAKYRAYRAPQLFVDILGKVFAGVLADQQLIAIDQFTQLVGGQLVVQLLVERLFHIVQQGVKWAL